MAYPNREELTVWWVNIHGGENVKNELHQPLQSRDFRQVSRPEGCDTGGGYRVAGLVAGQARREVRGQWVHNAHARDTEHLLQAAGVHIDGTPDERLAKFSIEVLGADKFMWAYDFPHSDSILDPVRELEENLAGLSEEDQLKVVWGECGGVV